MQFRHIIPCINRTAPYIIITVQSHKMFHKLSSKFLIPDLLSRLKEGIQANKCKQLNRIKRLFLFFIKMNFHCKLNKHTLTGIYRKQVLLYSIVVFRQSRIPASENDDTQNFNFGCKRWKTNHKSSLSAFFSTNNTSAHTKSLEMNIILHFDQFCIPKNIHFSYSRMHTRTGRNNVNGEFSLY